MIALSLDSSTGETAFYKIFASPRTEFSTGARTEDVYSKYKQRETIPMNLANQRAITVTTCLTMLAIAACWQTGTLVAGSGPKPHATTPDPPEPKVAVSWDQKAAASYLDRRQEWWMQWPRSQRDHDTFCVSCHTAVPYALSRQALRRAFAESTPSAGEQKLLDSVTKRVRLWKEVAPFYSDADRGAYKTVESRGTESVLNALILASRDAQSGQLSSDARTALENMWAEQQTSGNKKGAWLWLRFNNEPWEADDSDYYGATLAAVAIATAHGNYHASPEIQKNVTMLREYLNRESAAQKPVNRVSLLWAAAKMPGLIEPDRKKAIIAELLEKQQADGGWSLSSLTGEWKRSDGTPQEVNSDGYATGLISFALQQAGVAPEDPQLKRGLAWLTANQDKTAGSWLAYSLNKNKEHHLSPETALFMNDAATAYAVLALTNAGRH
jgi:squalene-hopene/tetraprenyl-beta-curcumene cyclase